jgi:hypothetical protein
MKTTIRISALVLAIAAAVAAQQSAAQVFIPTIHTKNRYQDKYLWVTIYDLGKLRHLDYGCVGPAGVRSWKSGNYAFGSFYYVRGEIKSGKDCSGQTICDTTVQVNPQNEGIISSGSAGKGPKHVMWYIHPNGNNCYWDENF